tara:strand:- start:1719 stop:1934 length:216 start_codon:yes stop_codon:yes gene_type:complete
MIGPQAYENLFQTKPVAATHEGYVICHGGKEYTYQLHMPEMFESISEWMDWCEEDVAINNGEYADSVEVVE